MNRMRGLSVIGLVAIGLLGAAAANGQSDLIVTLDAEKAVILHGEPGTWDGQYTDPGAVTYHDGQFHLFRNGFVGWPAWSGIAYLTSADGISWEAHGSDPIFVTEDVPFADTAAMASSVLVEDDGSWVMYLYVVGGSSSGPESFSIARATATDPAGPWTADPEPVLLPGDKDTWDSAYVMTPSVVKTPDGYRMYYEGAGSAGLPSARIGLATSPDGIAWTKHGDPVLLPGEEGAWDAAFVHQPRVVVTPDGFVMSYRSATLSGRDKSYGFATSTDGVQWQRFSANPYLSDRDVQRRALWFNALVYRDSVYYNFVEIGRGYQAQTDIYTAVIEGDLFE